MKRILWMVLMNLWYVPYGIIRLFRMAAHPERYSLEERYALIRQIDNRAIKGGRVVIQGDGMDRLPKDDGFILYPNPGVVETIRKLSGQVKVFIVSNCQSGYIELFLKKTGLAPYVTDTECFGDTGMKKAENIRLVVARNGLQLPVYVGDTKGDEEAAHAAGVPFVHAAYGFGRAGQPEAVIETFSELLTLIRTD